MLQLRGVSCTYPSGLRALDDVSLDIPPGMFGLLGPNGAGKSTLMRTIVTLQRPDTGQVMLHGIDALQDPARIRASLGYLPQDFGFHPNVPVQETLAHYVALKGLASPADRRATVEALLRRVNLWDARARAAGTLSGGMRQRLGVAIALCGDPRLLVLDEPTAGLDPGERHRLYDILAECGDQAVVLLSTHLVEDVSALCTSLAILDRGRVVAQGSPAALTRALEGRLWHRDVAPGEELPVLQRAHRVIAVRRHAGRRVAHLVADAPPDPRCRPAPPTLEDAYFATVGERAEDA